MQKAEQTFFFRLTVISLHFSRQFRVMEGDKEAYLDEATKALRRQRKIIEDLDREKSDLERSLRTAKSRQNSRRDGENAAKIARLAEEQVGKKIISSPPPFFFLLLIRCLLKKIAFLVLQKGAGSWFTSLKLEI